MTDRSNDTIESSRDTSHPNEGQTKPGTKQNEDTTNNKKTVTSEKTSSMGTVSKESNVGERRKRNKQPQKKATTPESTER